MTLGKSTDRVARFYRLPSGRWHGEVTGPDGAFCATSNRSLEAVIAFLTRRMTLDVPIGVCADGCEPISKGDARGQDTV